MNPRLDRLPGFEPAGLFLLTPGQYHKPEPVAVPDSNWSPGLCVRMGRCRRTDVDGSYSIIGRGWYKPYQLFLNIEDRPTLVRLIDYVATLCGLELGFSTPIWCAAPFKCYRIWSPGFGQYTFGAGVEEKFGDRETSRSKDVPAELYDGLDFSDENLTTLRLALSRTALYLASVHKFKEEG